MYREHASTGTSYWKGPFILLETKDSTATVLGTSGPQSFRLSYVKRYQQPQPEPESDSEVAEDIIARISCQTNVDKNNNQDAGNKHENIKKSSRQNNILCPL